MSLVTSPKVDVLDLKKFYFNLNFLLEEGGVIFVVVRFAFFSFLKGGDRIVSLDVYMPCRCQDHRKWHTRPLLNLK